MHTEEGIAEVSEHFPPVLKSDEKHIMSSEPGFPKKYIIDSYSFTSELRQQETWWTGSMRLHKQVIGVV